MNRRQGQNGWRMAGVAALVLGCFAAVSLAPLLGQAAAAPEDCARAVRELRVLAGSVLDEDEVLLDVRARQIVRLLDLPDELHQELLLEIKRIRIGGHYLWVRAREQARRETTPPRALDARLAAIGEGAAKETRKVFGEWALALACEDFRPRSPYRRPPPAR